MSRKRETEDVKELRRSKCLKGEQPVDNGNFRLGARGYLRTCQFRDKVCDGCMKKDATNPCSVCARCFYDAILKEVVGLDPDSGAPLNVEGHFGKVRAVLATIEEQSRKTLHAHILLWIEEIANKMEKVQCKRG